jgi:hypothetical protein
VTCDKLFFFTHSLESIGQCGAALCTVLEFSILSASIGSFVVRDKVTGAKMLQHVSGLGYRIDWFTDFLYDMMIGNSVHVCVCEGEEQEKLGHLRLFTKEAVFYR